MTSPPVHARYNYILLNFQVNVLAQALQLTTLQQIHKSISLTIWSETLWTAKYLLTYLVQSYPT